MGGVSAAMMLALMMFLAAAFDEVLCSWVVPWLDSFEEPGS